MALTKSIGFGVACLLAAHLAANPAGAIEGRSPADETTASHPQSATCDKAASFKLVMDVGHTPQATGAMSARAARAAGGGGVPNPATETRSVGRGH